MAMMKATIFVEPGRIELTDKPIPDVGPNDALIRITTTTICGTDIHIVKGEYPVASGLTIGHEPVGTIEKLGNAVLGYQEGQRVIAGAICPTFTSYASQDGFPSQDGSYLIPAGTCGHHGYKATAGWRFGNMIDGAQAEYVLVPDAQANLAPIPDGLSDEQVLMCPDIMSTGFKGAENANIRIGDVVAVFAQGPIGLCATAGARLLGASTIITVDGNDHRLEISRSMGADVTLNFRNCDVVGEIMKLTGGRGVDASIEALGTQGTFESCLRVLKPGGTLSSLGVYSQDLSIPLSAFAAGLGDHTISGPHRSVPGRQGAHAPADERGGIRARRLRHAGDAPVQARRHRRGLRPVREPARWRAEGCDQAELKPARSQAERNAANSKDVFARAASFDFAPAALRSGQRCSRLVGQDQQVRCRRSLLRAARTRLPSSSDGR